MAMFNINDFNKEKYVEVSFEEGISHIREHAGTKLHSDGLEFGEFIEYIDNDHFEYEDGCYLGTDSEEILQRTGGITSWILSHKFYIEKH